MRGQTNKMQTLYHIDINALSLYEVYDKLK